MTATFRRWADHNGGKRYAKKLQRSQFNLWYSRMVAPSGLVVDMLGLRNGITDAASIEKMTFVMAM